MQQHPGLLLRLQLPQLSQLLADQLVLRLLLLPRLGPALTFKQLVFQCVRLCGQLVRVKGLPHQATTRQQGPQQSPKRRHPPLLTCFLLALQHRVPQ